MNKIPYLVVLFKNSLRPIEIPEFRGAVISKVPKELTLFHNHLEDRFRFSYPLIQYKSIGGKAAIVCIGEGTNEIAGFFNAANFKLRVGEREEDFIVDNVWANQWLLQTWNDSFYYSVKRWLPLNKTNYSVFTSAEGIIEKTQLLESILIGNILSMSKGLNHRFAESLSCSITSIDNPWLYKHKGVKLQGFDIICKTNVYIPDFIGIGKGASMGFGMIKQINKNYKEEAYDRNE